jgi:hypothetical protein
MRTKEYGTQSGPKICPTLRAMLTETGEHVFRLAFGYEAETTRNFIFGVVVTQAALEPEDCGWSCLDQNRRCVYLCYELCDAFPLHENSEQYHQLQQAVERILEVSVRLLPFTPFQRSIGIYPALCEIFCHQEFSGIFRDDADSPRDRKMHVALSRWEQAAFLTPPAPPLLPGRVVETGLQVPQDEWSKCFQSIASVLWYHAYVCEVIGEDVSQGLSESNAFRTYEVVSASSDTHKAGKLELLDILKLVYRHNYTVV